MPRTIDYKGLKNSIVRAMQRAHTGDRNQKLSELTETDLERMLDFVQFMEDMHVQSVIALLTMLTYLELSNKLIDKGGSKEMYEQCVRDFDQNLHRTIHRVAAAGLLSFDPLHHKSHNEQVRDSIMDELGLKLERDRAANPNRIDRFPGRAESPQDAASDDPDPNTRH